MTKAAVHNLGKQQEMSMSGDPTGGMPQDQSIPKSITIPTRFGDIEFEWDKAIYMPVGLLGFPDHHAFGLANLPDSKLDQFKLLQCLTDPVLSFIVAPYNPQSAAIEQQDLDHAIASLAIPKEDVSVLLVVTLRANDEGGGISMSVNLQAPVILDTNRQIAWQFVMPHEKYPVQHQL